MPSPPAAKRPAPAALFDDLIESLAPEVPPHRQPTVDIDISQELGRAEGTVVFTLRKLDVPGIFRIAEESDAMHQADKRIPLMMCRMVCHLAAAHVAPATRSGGMSILEQYKHLAVRCLPAFQKLLVAHSEAFPDMQAPGYIQAAEAEKNA
jgi:hypothetical protein